ncbi:FAD-dependent oxidoreductase [Sphingomonas oligoaromativorans]|uniref:FAD-dependent oxidoreductase n=1 Tax=Sphingomonas oligoaromativorans TaxID=575322 RepID=UPI00141D9239|nr:cyclic nucleotide-binding domain-containing thioredoxin-disulfide reductase [Sphingomonas oligoaromativorans]NIJ35210.1 thioredoxin reductase (NADPH) [Sphingomonas oligoaromativorans]
MLAEEKVRKPHPREAQIFPRLDRETVDRLLPYGQLERPAPGTLLFERGARSADFFVVLDGEIELLDETGAQAPVPFHCYTVGQFTGELHLFNDRALLVSGRAGPGTHVLRIARPDFKRMVSTEADIGEMIMRAFILRRVDLIASGQGGVTLVGSSHAAETHRVRAFLTRNAHPYRLLDLDSDPSALEALAGFTIGMADLPLVLMPGGTALRNPAISELATTLGIDQAGDPDKVYDVAVVGAGPAGLAASVYAASEGLATVAVEGNAPGGQAGTSSRIENYLGFPTGISGHALAGRAQIQAQKFGARLAVSRPVAKLDCAERPFALTLEGGEVLRARTIVIATGARYRRLDLPGYAALEGRGVYYAATPMEAQLCKEQEAIVIGGGNSAGQAAVFLSRTCRHVHVLVRSEGLAATMSDYLVQRIADSPVITLHPFTEVTAVEGQDFLTHVTWTDRRIGASERREIGSLFVMIGADPNTPWLDGCVPLDDKGFVQTGTGQNGAPLASPYATSVPGIFAVGDVRSGSIKRVASGVGEGSVVISAVHQFLAALDDAS